MLWALTADREWSDLPEKPAYLPLVHEMIYHVMRDRWRESNLGVGERFSSPVPAEGTLVSFSVSLPGGSVEEVQPEPSGDRIEIRYDGTTRAGFYTVKRSGGVEAEHVFAVNCDPAESNLEPIGEMELRDLLGGWPVRLVTGRQDVAEAVKASRSGVEFWRELVTAVAVLLVVESVLAWLFGARRAQLGLSAKPAG
jgi:hypothetical protein